MSLNDYCKQAYLNFSTAKLRSCLAILGILIGTMAVVALLSCGQLATDKALTEFKTLGTDLLAIDVEPTDRHNSQNNPNMSVKIWYQLAQHVEAIKEIAPYASAYQKVMYKGHILDSVMIISADETLADVIHIELDQGFFVSFVESFEHFCVIGHDITSQLQRLGVDNPLGTQLQIGPYIYTIIGIAASWKENAFFNYDINHTIITPLNGISLISNNHNINNAILSLKPNVPIDATLTQIKDTMTQLAPKQTLFIRSAKQMLASMEAQGHIFTLLLAIIGSISLLVGGIGVMNVMLVAVSERKKEIGIRKAIGAKAHEIQQLFLMESVLLALFGGLLGVIGGELLTWIIAYCSGWSFTLYIIPPLAGFTVSSTAGIFFGYYPAKRAAQLEPIVSLRGD